MYVSNKLACSNWFNLKFYRREVIAEITTKHPAEIAQTAFGYYIDYFFTVYWIGAGQFSRSYSSFTLILLRFC